MDSRVKWLASGLICISGALHGFGQKSLISMRSQGVNAVRELAGWQQVIHQPDRDSTYAVMSVVPEYARSFNSDDLARVLFGCQELVFSGSQVVGRDSSDILADYFGLPSDFKSLVQFDPEIINFVMDFDWYIGLDEWAPGLYCRIHMPIVHTKWDLQLTECVTDSGTTFTSYPAGYFASTPIALTALTVGDTAPTNVKTALQGKAIFGDMRESLQFGKVFGRQSETRVSELWVAIGYNFLLSDWYHAGLAVRAAAPTGTLRKSEFLFEPIAGNDHHWEVGGVFTGHIDAWTDEKRDQRLGLYLDANITHMFSLQQKRSFDLKNNGNGSRYMLLEKIASPTAGLHVGLAPNNVVALNQYQGRLVPAINKTTLDANISVGVQADIAAKLSYQRRGFEFDIGYNFWGRSAEKIHERDCIETCYAVKGDAQLYGFTSMGETAVALNATQSNATINGGQAVSSTAFPGLNAGNFNTGYEFANINADNIANAADILGVALNQLNSADANRLGLSQVAVRTSNPAVLLTDCDIDECSALLPQAISHKLFFYVGYTAKRNTVTPYIGGGAFAEWGDPDCDNSATSQWGVWLKMGLSFG